MDLSDLLGGGGSEAGLNEDLSVMDTAGEKVFSAPFGAATAFAREKGVVRVACLFDPQQAYGELSKLASLENDYTEALRDALVKQFVAPEKLSKRKPTLQELEWEQVQKLPDKVLSDCIFKDPAKLAEYMELIRVRIRAAVVEEDELMEVLRTKKLWVSV